MTRVFYRRLYPKNSKEVTLCLGVEEDYIHFFFVCPFAWTIWNCQTISRVDTTLEMSFWESIQRSNSRRRAEGVCILVVPGQYSCTRTTSCSIEGRRSMTMSPMLWRVLWPSGPQDRGARGPIVIANQFYGSITVFSSDHSLHYSKKKKSFSSISL